MVLKIGGKRKHLWNILDFHSRCQISSLLLNGRGKREAGIILAEALKRTSGEKPGMIITDGLQSYNSAIKERAIRHTSNVALSDKKNNNRIERMHGSIRQFVRAKRGLKGNASLLLSGFSSYYNLVRPHMAVGNRPPLAETGTRDKWIGLLSTADDEP